jgi:hypothetical protein
MEQFLDYKMVEDRSVVEQAHEVQALAKELESYSKEAPCVLPTSLWQEQLSLSCHILGGILLPL